MKYLTLAEAQKRVEELLNDLDCVQRAKNFLAHHKTFDAEMALSSKVAGINFTAQADKTKILGTFFTDKEIVDLTIGFYKYIDELAGGDNSLETTAVDNLQYLELKHNAPWRSSCGHSGNDKWIKVNVEGRIGDAGNHAHEAGHAQSKGFTEFKALRDERMREFCTVIIDHIFPIYLQSVRPDLKENLAENFVEAQFINKSKAHDSLMEGMLMRLLAGKMTLQDNLNSYKKVYGNNLHPINILLDKIDRATAPNASEDDKFQPMFETRYLLPQMIATMVAEMFEENPQEVAKNFKNVLQNDCDLKLEDALKVMGLPEEEKIIDWYKDNVASLIDKKRQNLIAEEDEDESEIQ